MNMKKILVLLLTFTMLISAFAPTLGVFAAEVNSIETEKETINYVSLGDSMTNGLGLPGYDVTDNEGTGNDGRNGYLEVAPDTYPAQFAAWLAGMNDDDIVAQQGANILFEGTKGKVNLTQLATSGSRAEDILYMLYYDPDKLDEANTGLSMLNYGTPDQGKADYWVIEEMLKNSDRWGDPTNTNDKPFNDAVAETFQTAVRDADIISYSGANGNFGVFFVHRVLSIVGLGGDPEEERTYFPHMTFENAIKLAEDEAEIDEEFSKDLVEYVTNLYNDMCAYMEENKLPKDMIVEILDYLAYTVVSYLITYDKTMDYIAKVNPDAEVIILPLINNATTFEFDITLNGITKHFNAGEMLDMVYGSINAYTATYTVLKQATGDSGAVKFYYAQLPTDKNGEEMHVQTFVEVLDQLYVDVPENATELTYPESRFFCHSRFIGDIRGFIFPLLVGSSGEYFDENDVKAYEIAKANGYEAMAEYLYANQSKIQWIAQYLGVIDAVMAALSDTPNVNIDELEINDFSDLDLMGILAPKLNEIADNIPVNALSKTELAMQEAVYNLIYRDLVNANVVPTLAPYFADATYGPQLDYIFGLDAYPTDLDKTLRLIELAQENYGGFAETAALGLTAEALVGAHDQIVNNSAFIQGVAMLSVVPYLPEAMEEELCRIGIVEGLLSVYGRMKMANGLACHPSETGHDTLTLSLIEAYENDYTTVDETTEILKQILEYAKQNPELVYQYAYEYVDGEGYITRTVNSLNETIAALESAVDAVESGLAGLDSELADKVLSELNAIVDTFKGIRDALVNGDLSTYAGLMDKAYALEDELYAHLDSINGILAQAGYDYDNIVLPAIKDAADVFVSDVLPEFFTMAEEFAWAAVDFTLSNLDTIYYNFPAIVNGVYSHVLEKALWISFIVGEAVDVALDAIIEAYLIVYEVLVDVYGEAEKAVIMAGEYVYEIYTTLVLLDNRLGNPSRDYLNGYTIAECAELFRNFYYDVCADAEEALEMLNDLLADVAEKVEGELPNAIALYNAILEVLTDSYGNTADAVLVTGQIFSYVYDFAVDNDIAGNLKGHLDNIVDLIAETYRGTKDIEKVGAEIYAYVLEMFDDTFTADYELTVDSLYVALGNATYGEELAEMLHLAEKYHSFGLSDDYLDTLADADFVTVRLDNGELISFLMSQVTNYGTELDWSKHLDAEGQAALDRLLIDIENALLNTGAADQLAVLLNDVIAGTLDSSIATVDIGAELVANVLTYAIESVIYSYADSIDRLETVLANVHAVAPEATVVITGIQNPFEELDLSAFGVDLDEYLGAVDYLLDIFNAQLVAVAYANENTIYVDSVNAADIYAALTVTCKHSYTDCEDTTCDICGAERVAPGHKYGDWKVVKEATVDEEGREERTCEVCGHVDARSIAKLTPEPVPTPAPTPEGPKNNPAPIIIAACIAVAAIAGFVVWKRKQTPTPDAPIDEEAPVEEAPVDEGTPADEE